MERGRIYSVATLGVGILFFLASVAWAQIDVGNFTISGSADVGGLPGHNHGEDAQFERYRDIPESVIVPQLQLMIGGKKEDFYLNFDSAKLGRDDQNYRLRFGRYGLLDVEVEWDQTPHNFNLDNARTPYTMRNGTYTLPVRTTADDSATFSTWIRDNARLVDLDLLNKVGKLTIRYTPTPGWSFTGRYWSQNSDGRRAFATPFGSGSSSNVAELAEPIKYQTHNIELGGEYGGDGWSLGLRYNGSLFHNSVSTLIWDNPAAIGPEPCTDYYTINYDTGRGPCRGRLDLYPSNQAHTWTLTGAAKLPFKSNFRGTVSYGVRLQDDPFLPFTINACWSGGPCGEALRTMPQLSRSSLNGDVRPMMVNLSLVNNFVDRLNLKAYYRFYELNNHYASVSTNGTVRNDQRSSATDSDWTETHRYQYAKNNIGLDAGYSFTRWLTAKFGYGYERLNRAHVGEFHNSTEHSIGPTLNIKPSSWLLLRAAYKHSWRDAPGYFGGTTAREMFYLTKRDQNKGSFFADFSPWETLSFNGGFEFTSDTYPGTRFGIQSARNLSPSIGVLHAPLEWLKLFADYNFDRSAWRNEVGSSTSATRWSARGKDWAQTISLGSDMDLIKDLLGFRIQYGFSRGSSRISNGSAGGGDYPSNKSNWHELLARLEYRLHKNVAMHIGYYMNIWRSQDYGVDIMDVWMGDYDNNSGQLRSAYLGDRFKEPYTAHVGFLGLRLSF